MLLLPLLLLLLPVISTRYQAGQEARWVCHGMLSTAAPAAAAIAAIAAAIAVQASTAAYNEEFVLQGGAHCQRDLVLAGLLSWPWLTAVHVRGVC